MQYPLPMHDAKWQRQTLQCVARVHDEAQTAESCIMEVSTGEHRCCVAVSANFGSVP